MDAISSELAEFPPDFIATAPEARTELTDWYVP
jgi:hypothetical protein